MQITLLCDMILRDSNSSLVDLRYLADLRNWNRDGDLRPRFLFCRDSSWTPVLQPTRWTCCDDDELVSIDCQRWCKAASSGDVDLCEPRERYLSASSRCNSPPVSIMYVVWTAPSMSRSNECCSNVDDGN